MKVSTNHLKRYKEIIALFWKYGRSDLARQINLTGDDLEFKAADAPGDGADPAQLADDLGSVGGGQQAHPPAGETGGEDALRGGIRQSICRQ